MESSDWNRVCSPRCVLYHVEEEKEREYTRSQLLLLLRVTGSITHITIPLLLKSNFG